MLPARTPQQVFPPQPSLVNEFQDTGRHFCSTLPSPHWPPPPIPIPAQLQSYNLPRPAAPLLSHWLLPLPFSARPRLLHSLLHYFSVQCCPVLPCTAALYCQYWPLRPVHFNLVCCSVNTPLPPPLPLTSLPLPTWPPSQSPSCNHPPGRERTPFSAQDLPEQDIPGIRKNSS